MAHYAIFDVEIRDLEKYKEYMAQVKPLIEAASGRYLVRGGPHQVIEGDWQPRRLVIVEFPSAEAIKSFYESPVYQGLKELRQAASSGAIVVVEGVDASA
jgi:uncharacterized protein (DUF1330 family)